MELSAVVFEAEEMPLSTGAPVVPCLPGFFLSLDGPVPVLLGAGSLEVLGRDDEDEGDEEDALETCTFLT